MTVSRVTIGLIAGLAILGATGCSDNNTVNAATGAAVGAGLGSLVGSGTGRNAAIAAGAIGGAALGASANDRKCQNDPSQCP